MAFFDEAVISGFIGEVVSRCVDVSWTKIKEAVKNRNNKHQNIESQIYNVIVDVLNQITYNKFENDQDKIYQVAEKLLLGYKENGYDKREGLRTGLQILGERVDDDKIVEFNVLLYQELSKNEYAELYRQIRLLQQEMESNKTSRIEQKMDKVQQGVDETNRILDAFQDINKRTDNVQNEKTVKSRTQEYADKWNENMFLNDFDEWDENAGVNIKLSDVYIDTHLPHFVWGDNKNVSNNLKELLSKYIVKKCENDMLLILGQPGIGKSTLITLITANFANSMDDILVYKFASDLGNVDWSANKPHKRMLEALNLSSNELNGKTLILDGFDEVSIRVDRKDLLDEIYWGLIKTEGFKKFTLIITCRENYIDGFERIKCKYIRLQPWDETQIKSFCAVFQKNAKTNISEYTIDNILKNRTILGIPLILYMVLALNISIEQENSIVEVYDKIFSLEGGIYDRCIDNKSFADKHRVAEVKKQIHQISREIAIWMFENNPEEASISQKGYIDICDGVKCKIVTENVEIQQDFKIGSYFKLIKHCDGIDTEELSFVHRSIYEYFVAEAIYSSIENAMKELSEEGQKKLAGSIGFYLKYGKLTPVIGEYLSYKIMKLYNNVLKDEEQKKFYQYWESTVDKMMRDGMFYYTKMNIQEYKDIIMRESNCFFNLLEILRLLLPISDRNYVIESVNKYNLDKYVRLRQPRRNYSKVFLQEADFRGEYLHEVDFRKANLAGANLSRADLGKADLNGADLSGADLRYAILIEADLRNAKLIGADLRNVELIGADLVDADLTRANLMGADITRANLVGTKLNESKWILNDVQNVAHRLQEADFSYIYVHYGRKLNKATLMTKETLVSGKGWTKMHYKYSKWL